MSHLNQLGKYTLKPYDYFKTCISVKDLYEGYDKHKSPAYFDKPYHKKKPKLVERRGKVIKVAGRRRDTEALRKERVRNYYTQSDTFIIAAVNKIFIQIFNTVIFGNAIFEFKDGKSKVTTIEFISKGEYPKNKYYLSVNHKTKRKIPRSRNRYNTRSYKYFVSIPASTQHHITNIIQKYGKMERGDNSSRQVLTIESEVKKSNIQFTKDVSNVEIADLVKIMMRRLVFGLEFGCDFIFYEFDKKLIASTPGLNTEIYFKRWVVNSDGFEYEYYTDRMIRKARCTRVFADTPYQGYYYMALDPLEFRVFQHSEIPKKLYLSLKELHLRERGDTHPHIFTVLVDKNLKYLNAKKDFDYIINKTVQYEKGITEYLQRWDGEGFKPADDSQLGFD